MCVFGLSSGVSDRYRVGCVSVKSLYDGVTFEHARQACGTVAASAVLAKIIDT